MRAHVFMPKALASDTTLIKVRALKLDDINVKVHATGVLKVDTDTPGAGPDKLATARPPIDSWFCLEWRISIGAPSMTGHHTLLLDGKVILDADEDTSTAEGCGDVDLGFSFSTGTLFQEIFFDDFAIANQPLPCPAGP
jgi:hypothetical protein